MPDDNRGQLPGRTRSQPRTLFERLVCEEGLGYCCPYALFRVTRRTGAIAIRLGMSDRIVRIWKARFRNKELSCENKPTCMIAHIRSIGR